MHSVTLKPNQCGWTKIIDAGKSHIFIGFSGDTP
jgi:hypothetical protein